MERADLLRILEGDVNHIAYVDIHDIALFNMKLIVEPIHVRKMLDRYLTEKISANDLNKWAIFICFRTEYISADPLNDELVDYFDDMFYVIQCLSAPELDGEINKKSVLAYLAELDKYPKCS